MTIGARLREAVAVKCGSVSAFHEEMSERLTGGKSGTAYNTILSYIHDDSEPSLEFVRQAAVVLGVSPAWLAFGETGGECSECAVRQARIRRAVEILEGK